MKIKLLMTLMILALAGISVAGVPGIPVLNAKVGYPQKLSGEVGWILGPSRDGGSWNTESTGAYVSISPGIAGTKLSVGYAALDVNMIGWAGARLSASYMYIYDDVGKYDAESQYLGPEYNLSILLFTANLGVLWPVNGGDPRIIAGIGVGW
ncbi:hypothetical protein EGM51_04515 [Verrucomicrobia bacterium S94]|nr:hypothetical protein EGM51_04515 [Verrucomicrobia bacterium S94]